MSDGERPARDPVPRGTGGDRARAAPGPVAGRRDADCVLRDGTRLRTAAAGSSPTVGRRASALSVDPVTGLGERRPVVPGRELEVVVDLWSTAHTFLPGHRVRVDIAPSSSPRWEAGRNAFDVDGTAARPAAAEYTIRHGAARPSRLVLQVAATAPE